jgi:hypothetical protein
VHINVTFTAVRDMCADSEYRLFEGIPCEKSSMKLLRTTGLENHLLHARVTRYHNWTLRRSEQASCTFVDSHRLTITMPTHVNDPFLPHFFYDSRHSSGLISGTKPTREPDSRNTNAANAKAFLTDTAARSSVFARKITGIFSCKKVR